MISQLEIRIKQLWGSPETRLFGSPKEIKMNRVTILVLMVVFLCGISANSQTPKRIEFARGKSSAVVKGLTGTYGTTYVLRARSGQKLVIDLSPVSSIGVKVETVGTYGEMVLLREESGGRYEVGLEESGDVTIFVGSTNGKSVPFTLVVRITKMTDI
jgi:hypothetical protein